MTSNLCSWPGDKHQSDELSLCLTLSLTQSIETIVDSNDDHIALRQEVPRVLVGGPHDEPAAVEIHQHRVQGGG